MRKKANIVKLILKEFDFITVLSFKRNLNFITKRSMADAIRLRFGLMIIRLRLGQLTVLTK